MEHARSPAGGWLDPGDSSIAIDDLVERCIGSDPRAWDLLVGRFERLVYAVPLRLGLGPEDAADVAQETFISLLRSLPTITEVASLPSWLMTVARRLSWRRLPGRDTPADSELRDLEDPADELVDALWVCEAVELLGEPCASIIKSLFLDDSEPSYAQIAERLGCSIGTVGPLRLRCLSRLRTVLEQGIAP